MRHLNSRFLCAAMCAALLALSAQAKTLAQISDERACTQDSDCVLIEGVCGKTAVNRDYKNNAEDYYKAQTKNAKCVEKFWVTQNLVAECKPLAGSKANKDAQIKSHGTCRAVAKSSQKN